MKARDVSNQPEDDLKRQFENMGVPSEGLFDAVDALKSMDIPDFVAYMQQEYDIDDAQAQQMFESYWDQVGQGARQDGPASQQPYYPQPFFNSKQMPRKGALMSSIKARDHIVMPSGTEAMEVLKVNEITGRGVARDSRGRTRDFNLSEVKLASSFGPASFPGSTGSATPAGGVPSQNPGDGGIRLPFGGRKKLEDRKHGAHQLEGVKSYKQADHMLGAKPQGGTVKKGNLGTDLKDKFPVGEDIPARKGHDDQDPKAKLPKLPTGITQSTLADQIEHALAISSGVGRSLRQPQKVLKSFDAKLRQQFPQDWNRGFQDAKGGKESQAQGSGDAEMAYYDGYYEAGAGVEQGQSGQAPEQGAAFTQPQTTSLAQGLRQLLSARRPIRSQRERSIGDRLYDYLDRAKSGNDGEAMQNLAVFLGEHDLSEYLGENKSAQAATSKILDKADTDDIDYFLQAVEQGEPYTVYDDNMEGSADMGGELPMGDFTNDEGDQDLDLMEAQQVDDQNLDESLGDLENQEFADLGQEPPPTKPVGKAPSDPNLEQ